MTEAETPQAETRFRLCQTAQAHAELVRCRKSIEAQRLGIPNSYWCDWAFADILLEKAAAMIGDRIGFRGRSIGSNLLSGPPPANINSGKVAKKSHDLS